MAKKKRSVHRVERGATTDQRPKTKASKKRAARRQRAAQKRRQQIVTGVLVLAVIGVFGGWVASRSVAAPSVSAERLALVASKGPANAPVTITEYGDFNCPSCKAWHDAGIFDQVLARYDGQVRFEFRHFPVITPRSPRLAEAAECANDQGQFWEMHDMLYDFSPTNSDATLKEFASQIGVDRTQFDECLDTDRYAPLVREHQNQAFSLGFRGTPSFTINGQPLVNPSPEVMYNIIDRVLASGS
ncbi:MAG: DsbA family protein [Anaerolineales bacterium]